MAKKILLADDSITIQKVISITFASENYELIIVGDGDSALKRAREAKPDLIMADVAMPGKNGYELCEAVKNDPDISSTPVLLLGGTFEPLNRTEAERVGADDSIIKPFESQELLNKVSELLEKADLSAGVPEAAPKEEAGGAEAGLWGEGNYLGFPEEIEEKPAIKGADQIPDLNFLEGGSAFEEPEKEAPAGEDFTDLDLSEEDFGRAEASEEPAPAPEPEKSVEPEEPRPFWAEDVSRDGEDFGELKDISDFPDVFAEEPPAVTEATHEEAVEEVTAYTSPFEEHAPAEAEREEPSFAAPYHEEPAVEEPVLAEEPAPFEQASAPSAPEPVYEPAPAEAPAPVEQAVAEEAAERLKPIEVPKEELEEAVRKAVKEVVEQIAWEVVPELAEELIKAEIEKVKEALTRLK